jgi:hypothetical protein
MWQTVVLLAQSVLAPLTAVLALLVAVVVLALGIAYWQLSRDQGAGIIFDAKGLMLNLGASSAFVAWENIAAVGVCRHRANLLTLGSQKQLGIRVHDLAPYLQSYERRLPAARGPLAWALGQLRRGLRDCEHYSVAALPQQFAHQRARTGYDILVPETMLGGAAEGFVKLVESYLTEPDRRSVLGHWL